MSNDGIIDNREVAYKCSKCGAVIYLPPAFVSAICPRCSERITQEHIIYTRRLIRDG